jgi:hypothetical protein
LKIQTGGTTMKKFLMAKLVSLLLIGTGYAIQRPSEDKAVSSGVSSQASCGIECLRSSVQQNPRQTKRTAGKEMAARESGSVQSTFSTLHSAQKGTTSKGTVGSAKQSLWFVQEAVYETKSSRARPRPQDREVARFTTQQMQLCNWLARRIPGALSTGRSISTKVEELACAMARTEGWMVSGSLPNRLHNPGDIRSRLKNAYPGQIGLYHGYVIFRNDRAGWRVLEDQIIAIVTGESKRYVQGMTFAQIAKVYAASPQWPKTFCKILHISPQLTFQEYFGLAPRVLVTEARHGFPLWAPSSAPMPVLQEMLIMQASLY